MMMPPQQTVITTPSGMAFSSNWRNAADPSNNQRYFCAFSPENRYHVGSSLRSFTQNLPDGRYTGNFVSISFSHHFRLILIPT